MEGGFPSGETFYRGKILRPGGCHCTNPVLRKAPRPWGFISSVSPKLGALCATASADVVANGFSLPGFHLFQISVMLSHNLSHKKKTFMLMVSTLYFPILTILGVVSEVLLEKK